MGAPTLDKDALPGCEDCIRGTIHKGTPVGTIEKIYNYDTYVVGNKTNPRAVIVMLTDVFGLPLVNNKLIADAYAKGGDYSVYVPDFFNGDPFPLKYIDVILPVGDGKDPGFLGKMMQLPSGLMFFMGWGKRQEHTVFQSRVNGFLRQLKEEKKAKVGVVGFCWGGRYALIAGQKKHNLSENEPLVDAVVAHHPSRLDVPVDTTHIAVPASYGWGAQDKGVPLSVMEAVKKVEAEAKNRPPTEHVVYKPGKHGFAVRGNPAVKEEAETLAKTVEQVLGWFEKYL